MRNDSKKHDRHSIRIPGFDYGASGAFFITAVAYRRRHMFGRVSEGKVVLSDYGEVVKEEWQRTALLRPYVHLDIYVIMTDHFHAILWFTDRRDTARRVPTEERFSKPVAGLLPAVVRLFKSACTRRINIMRSASWSPVWQPGYYDRVIRSEGELFLLRSYVRDNPYRWREGHR
jgi:REP element-mobilizing transposase RayT